MAASTHQTMDAINAACQARGGKYASYSCKVVSWDDVSRGTMGGSLSCLGANITDTYLKSRSGERLFTVRSDNWNEKLGAVCADDVALVASRSRGEALRPVTLRTFLEQIGSYGSYAGLNRECNLSDAQLDKECSIRFQTTFLPVATASASLLRSFRSFFGGGPPAKMDFCTEAYNYNTRSDDDPRNLVLLCTSQGVAVQQDGQGAKKLLHHTVDDEKKIHRHWLEAEETRHHVGGQQKETAEEKQDALARGKATASVIGTRAMGQRFNVLMTIQVPLKQKRQAARVPLAAMDSTMLLEQLSEQLSAIKDMNSSLAEQLSDMNSSLAMIECCCEQSASLSVNSMSLSRQSHSLKKATGRSSAARVSKGQEYDVWNGLSVNSPERNECERITITVVIYNTVTDGVPSEVDVVQAIEDMEALYESTGKTGRLSDLDFDFMKKPLEAQDVEQISAKLEFQPPSQAVEKFDAFPTS